MERVSVSWFHTEAAPPVVLLLDVPRSQCTRRSSEKHTCLFRNSKIQHSLPHPDMTIGVGWQRRVGGGVESGHQEGYLKSVSQSVSILWSILYSLIIIATEPTSNNRDS